MFRMPDGSRAARRFPLDAPVGQLFHFCDARGAGGMRPGSYRLLMQYPRRVIDPPSPAPSAAAPPAAAANALMAPAGSPADSYYSSGCGLMTLAAAGLVAGQQETVMLEAVTGEPASPMGGATPAVGAGTKVGGER